MTRIWLAGISAIGLVTVGAARARAEDISAKSIFIKDNANPAKRRAQVQSNDAGVQLSEVDDPGTNGASLHLYSATDDFCVTLPSGADWRNTGTKWKYKNKTTKNTAQVKDGKLAVKIKSGVTYTLADDGTQGTVDAQVQFGNGTRYCMRCTGNKKDDGSKFLGKACAASPCDPEPSSCNPFTTTTSTTATSTTGTGTTATGTTSTGTTSTGTSGTGTTATSTTATSTSSTTSTTCPPPTGTVVKGSLTATVGRFNYNLTLGLPGANAACSSNFGGAHACTYAELQSAPASDRACLKDTAGTPVTSFWAIDSSADPVTAQCFDDVNFDPILNPGHNWEYGTAHTASRGQRVTLNNATGALGSLQSGVQCNIAGTNWVGCCQ